MPKQELYFNALTLDWPKEKIQFYFSPEKQEKCVRLHKTLFPVHIESIFPKINEEGTSFIYTSFEEPREGFTSLQIDLSEEPPNLIKRYYNWRICHYFRHIKGYIARTGFIKETQVWIKNKRTVNQFWDVYDKYSLKVQVQRISKYPELVVSFDGQSKVLKKSVALLVKEVSPKHFNYVIAENTLCKWKYLTDEVDHDNVFPVLNRDIEAALGIEPETPTRDNRYIGYFMNISDFYNEHLNNQEFKEHIPLNVDNFIPVPKTKIFKTSPESNLLLFGNGKSGIVPVQALKTHKPYKQSPFNKIHLFFILHVDDIITSHKLMEHFAEGFKWFKGLYAYARLLFHTEKGFSIVFKDKDNPIPEIEAALNNRSFDPDLRYIAVYITPFGKFEQDQQKREIYYQVKEMLLKRRITSQAIDGNKMNEQGDNWVYSLPNIAIAMLAKLDGIPWQLNNPAKKELIVGVGAFKHLNEGVHYIGSAFSFTNNGRFNRFEYFMKDEIDMLAGSVSSAVKEFATIHEDPERLVIHFYKTMSEKELFPIMNALKDLGLSIPVIIISINKTESEDIVAFDGTWNQLMPLSGTYINIGYHSYLLFNNTRYESHIHNRSEGYPFPIKLKMQCTDPELLKDTKVVRELIDQVYQFSRMYWKSVRQQNLPVTIKYPEMVAQIAPHFIGNEIPEYGKENLWFL
jgi:hypothetical protein